MRLRGRAQKTTRALGISSCKAAACATKSRNASIQGSQPRVQVCRLDEGLPIIYEPLLTCLDDHWCTRSTPLIISSRLVRRITACLRSDRCMEGPRQ
eukprot:8396284-Karenia_brevis.AAC.1